MVNEIITGLILHLIRMIDEIVLIKMVYEINIWGFSHSLFKMHVTFLEITSPGTFIVTITVH